MGVGGGVGREAGRRGRRRTQYIGGRGDGCRGWGGEAEEENTIYRG